MQINAYSPSSVIAAQQGPAGNPTDNAAPQAAKDKARTSSSALSSSEAQTASTSSDTVSLTKLSAADLAALDKQAANDGNGGSSKLLYAEVWKDGVKVGEVYSDGRVIGEGSTLDLGGTGVLSAQTRAQQLASQTGGEVRYPGQQDSKTEKVRAQLRAAYGV